MAAEFDLVLRGGLVVDGTGAPAYEADVAVVAGRIAAVGPRLGAGAEEIDARGLIVTPGFVDIHTHYDGQVTWEDRLAPSSSHGVTTVVMGNCGVGFAPCRPNDRQALLRLMEGVEDLPEPVLAAGVPWDWESFEEYFAFLERRAYDIDIAAYVPHAAVRLHVMGERALEREPATAADSQAMAELVSEAIRSGALGFSTSRTINHRSTDGRLTPTFGAEEAELTAIAHALRAAGAGMMQGITDFDDEAAEMAMLGRVFRASGRPCHLTVMQRHRHGDQWRRVMDWISGLNAQGAEVRGQVACRHVGLLMGLELSSNPLKDAPSYSAVAPLPLAERVAALRAPELRSRILAELECVISPYPATEGYAFDLAPHSEPGPELFVAAIARERDVTPMEVVYDLLLEHGGRGLVAKPTSNYGAGSLDVCREMIDHPHTVIGLSDGGAHVGILCDAGQPTHLLSYWARDRKGDRISLEQAVAAVSRETAHAVGLRDRGVIAPGLRADLNVIDFDRLQLHPPHVTYDLPAGGRRLRQEASGYSATIVAGRVISRDGVDTGERPGRLVRGAR